MKLSSSTNNGFESAEAESVRRPRDARSSVSFPFIAAIVVGFVVFWPVGLALLAWALWSEQIMAFAPVRKLLDKGMPSAPSFASVRDRMGRRPSNSALAEYLEQEQARLKAEQAKLDELVQAFEAFKAAERQAADKRDFDEFLRAREASGVDDLAAGDASRN